MKKYLAPIAGLTMPFWALAQSTAVSGTGLGNLLSLTLSIINALLPVLLALASIIFIWGVVTYITAAGDEEKRKKGQQRIIYGLIGLFVLVAFWGIVNVAVTTLGLNVTPPTPPVIL